MTLATLTERVTCFLDGEGFLAGLSPEQQRELIAKVADDLAYYLAYPEQLDAP